MRCVTFVCIILFLSVLTEVNTLDICNKKIIENIYKINNQPKCALETIYALGHTTFWALPKENLSHNSSLHCIEFYLEKPFNKSTTGHLTYHFYNTSRIVNYAYHDQGKGHAVELDESGYMFHVYGLNIPGMSCYYRCADTIIDGWDYGWDYGWDFGGIEVPIDTQDDPDVLRAVAECKRKLRDVGLSEEFVDITTCSEC
ncbi:uncharacterized protein LOC124358604 isoform X1 [Homalodisca vitripennis]|uniref:uncharacterized protein LOC124358604 isoform X1 n=1 Tax=Homalodisca vitripennis TaxID=197043 RepID=UPI001EEAA02B|nr:uncharacterized protein LOC124358604 isoform X1 [Homalodisca vitripennis]